LKALQFLELPLADQVRQLDKWDDGDDAPGFKEFITSFVDDVVFPFKPGTREENWSDIIIATAGGLGFAGIQQIAMNYLNVVTEARLTAGLAAKLRARLAG
jgi:hypothetical protein